MPEALPIVEQITQNIVDTLLGITTAGDYQQTLSQVARASRLGVDSDGNSVVVDNGAIVCELDPDPDDADAAVMSKRWTQGYAVLLLVFESEASEYPARKRLQILRADITKALMLDYTRGGKASDTKIRTPQWMDNASDHGALDGLIYLFDVDYSEDINDPYTLRT